MLGDDDDGVDYYLLKKKFSALENTFGGNKVFSNKSVRNFETILFPQDMIHNIYVTLEYNTYIDRSNMKCGPI